MNPSTFPTRLLCLVLWIGLTLPASPAGALVFTDDPANHRIDPSGPLAGVGQLSTGASGVLVGRGNYALTAAHAIGSVEGADFTLQLPDEALALEIVEKIVHPRLDLALLRLEAHAPITGYELYTADDEVGQVGVVAGYGRIGTEGASPTSSNHQGYWGTNRIARAWPDVLLMDFEAPDWAGSTGVLEACPAPGDSGGATFLVVDGAYLLAGIHETLTDRDGDGLFPEYRDTAGDVRISAVADWVYGNMPHAPEPTSLVLLLGGLAGCLRRRPRSV